MRRVALFAGSLGAALLLASSAPAMNTDDIVKLCQAGFAPERIAKIVDATGLDQPLTGADWARLKSEGCGDDVIDALLTVLVPAGEETEPAEKETSPSSVHRSYDGDVDIYVNGGWGWDGWYGSLFWGGSPYWSVGWSAWDPWWGWDWCGWGPGYGGYDPWAYSFHHRYWNTFYDPFYYCDRHYSGGFYSGGFYARQKEARRGGWRGQGYSNYAVAKSSPLIQQASYAVVRSKPYRAGTVPALVRDNAVSYQKSTGERVIAVPKSAISRSRASDYKSAPMTTRSQAGKQIRSGTAAWPDRYATKKSGTAPAGTKPTTGAVARPKTTVRSTPKPPAKGGEESGTVREKTPRSSGSSRTPERSYYRAYTPRPAGNQARSYRETWSPRAPGARTTANRADAAPRGGPQAPSGIARPRGRN